MNGSPTVNFNTAYMNIRINRISPNIFLPERQSLSLLQYIIISKVSPMIADK